METNIDMMGWKDAKLRDLICDFKRGIAYSSEDISSPNGIPMMNLASIDKTGYYREGEMKFYSGRYDEADKIYPDEMLIACTDLTRDAIIIGTPIKVPNESDFFLFTMDLAKLRPNDCIDPDFLYYALKTNTYRKYIKPWASGTNVLHLNLNGVYNYTLKYPVSKNAQKSIARILLNIDKKIAINKCINHYLEAMAKQLYDYWFVQFDFPDANGKPYKSSGGKMVWNKKLKREIPEGWTLQPFSKYMNIFTGKKDVSKVTPGNHKFFSCAPDPITSNEYIYDGEAILVSGNGSYTGRVSYYNGKMDLYQRTYGCSPKSTYASIMPFMYYHMKLMFEPLNTGGKHGSSIPYIVLGDLADFFILEDVSVMKKFSELINPLFRTHMEYMAKSTELLQEYKDMILPLLMAGQVSVTPLNNDL